ncbi:mutator transposase mudra protein [Citrus sinensis]|uniref:Mutator transposase mudra protein n=1 Tax=Citrus sinensis TaxID=2711 RepID=A0ACB8NNQ0_CITSI|nr:mutator transposase mudra protein [Citrus sinensis]
MRSTMLPSEFRRRPASEQPAIEESSSLVYFDIDVVIDGEVFVVGLAIPQQYSLHKMWTDIRDVCCGHPIRDENGIKVQVMFPWQSEQQASNKSANVDQCVTPEDQFPIHLNEDIEFDWIDFAEATDTMSVVHKHPDKFTQQLNNEADNGNEKLHDGYIGFANELDEFKNDYEYEAVVDGSYPDDSDSSHLFRSESDNDRDLDDYESGDDSGDDSEDDFEEQTCIGYEKNAGGFDFNSVGDEIVLRPGQLFVSAYEFRKVLKVFAIRNGFRLKRLKNEKTKVTCVVDDNFEASSYWIAATYLHLFKANPDIKISVIAAGLLQKYMHALLNSNLGSTVSLERDWFVGAEFPIFKRPYRGVLLTAVSIDANYDIYPLAMCVAETENNDSCDRQKGVLNALDRIFPLSLKRYCCRHIYANFKQKFPRLLLKKVFWRACRSSNAADFNSHMEELKTITPEGGFSIVRMFEEIRRKTMHLIHRRHEATLEWNNELPPVVRRKIIKGREEAISLSVIFGHNETFEILEDVTKIVVVDLLKRKCDCGEWAISGMPCKHALCCIDAKRYNVEDYVHPFLKKAAYIAAYKHQIIPVPDEKRWPLLLHDNLQPPAIIRFVGRPQTKIRREVGESSTSKRSSSVRCSRYDHRGHNKRTCLRATNDQMKKDKALVSDMSSQHIDIQISQTQSFAQNNGHLTQE